MPPQINHAMMRKHAAHHGKVFTNVMPEHSHLRSSAGRYAFEWNEPQRVGGEQPCAQRMYVCQYCLKPPQRNREYDLRSPGPLLAFAAPAARFWQGSIVRSDKRRTARVC